MAGEKTREKRRRTFTREQILVACEEVAEVASEFKTLKAQVEAAKFEGSLLIDGGDAVHQGVTALTRSASRLREALKLARIPEAIRGTPETDPETIPGSVLESAPDTGKNTAQQRKAARSKGTNKSPQSANG